MAQHLINPHSFKSGKTPATTSVEYGEIAVNCNSNDPFISIKVATSPTATGKIEKFSPDSVIDKKFVIAKGDADNSAVLKGEYQGYSNKAISQTSMAVGGASNAGLKGWYYSGIDFTNNKIYLSRTQPNSIKTAGFTTDTSITLDDIQGPEEGLIIKKRTQYVVGDSISIVCDAKYENKCKITAVEPGVITVDAIPFTSDKLPSYILGVGKQPDDFTLYSVIPEVNSTTKQLTVRNWNQGDIDLGGAALAEGANTYATNIASHAEGIQTVAYGQYSHTEGFGTQAAYSAHAEGSQTKALGNASHTEGTGTQALNSNAHAEGFETEVKGYAGHAEGKGTKVLSDYGHSEGELTEVSVNSISAHAEGMRTKASNTAAHAEGRNTIAAGLYSHAEGYNADNNIDYGAFGPISHVEGYANTTTSTANSAHAEGRLNTVSGMGAHAEGISNIASGEASHAEGNESIASGQASHAEGFRTKTTNVAEHASGKYNQSTQSSDTSQATQFSIGIGTSEDVRKNAFEVKQNGDIYIEGVEGKIQDKLNVSPDWNAQEGELGYIENRTHYSYVFDESVVYDENSNFSIISFYIDISNAIIAKDGVFGFALIVNISTSLGEAVIGINTEQYMEMEAGNWVLITANFPNESIDLYVSYHEYTDLFKKEAVISIDGAVYGTYQLGCALVKQLDSDYLPDTVVKTTPQTLPNANKNQVLTNLGIQDKLDKLVNITYSELKSLRDSSKLVPGMQYRITDYVTTTTQSNTRIAEEYHQFDIIVIADDVNVLNENARAIQHEGDTYFANSDLNVWELKYCFDNDTSRFAWADNKIDYIIHVPVSDSMRESLQSSVAGISSIPDTLIITWWDTPRNGPDGYGLDFYKVTNIQMPADDVLMIAFTCGSIPQSGVEFNETIFNSDGTELPGNCFYLNTAPTESIIDTLPTVINENIGKGVIYRMVDEWNNDCPYDFKNIQFVHPNDTTAYPDYYYTFSTVIDNNVTDSSMPQGYCYNNIIKEYIDISQKLNRNVFINTVEIFYCCSNSFGNNCYNNSFGNNCNSNSFKNNCYRNSFGNLCHSNSFGNLCHSNSFGYNCFFNSFGSVYQNNSFGNVCIFNSFGNNCSSNSFGDGCQFNSFGNNCYANHLGTACQSNSFGNYCCYNSFRMSNSKDASLRDYCFYNHFDDGCCYNVIWNTDTTGSSYVLKNININRGILGKSSSYNMINIDILNQDYEIQVAKNSTGEIKIYCEADLIA